MRVIVKLPLVLKPLVTPVVASDPPVGALMSLVKLIVVAVLALPAVSVLVMLLLVGFVGFAVHEYALELNGPAQPTVSVSCVQPVVAIAGKVVEAGPESTSVTVLTSVNEPAALLL